MSHLVRIQIDGSFHNVPSTALSGSEVLRRAGKTSDGWAVNVRWHHARRTRLPLDEFVDPTNEGITRYETVRRTPSQRPRPTTAPDRTDDNLLTRNARMLEAALLEVGRAQLPQPNQDAIASLTLTIEKLEASGRRTECELRRLQEHLDALCETLPLLKRARDLLTNRTAEGSNTITEAIEELVALGDRLETPRPQEVSP